MPAGNLSDQIARSLRASIISGQMVPGVTYSVPALAEEFGVSSMPVREAVLALVQRGLMSAVPNKGFRVVELTDKDLDDIMELRLMLEVPAVVNASSAVTDKLMVELRKIAKDIARAAKSGQLVDYLEADRHFHLTLTALADNPRLNDIIDDLRSRSRLTGLGTLVERGALTESAHEHVQMLDAIAVRLHDKFLVRSVTAHHAATAMQCGCDGEQCCPRILRRAGDDPDHAARVLVRIRRRRCEPCTGISDRCVCRLHFDADIGEQHFPTVHGSRCDDVRRTKRTEGDGHVRTDGDTGDGTGIGVHTAGDVDGEREDLRIVECTCNQCRIPVE